MSLKAFHIVFVTVSTLLAFLFGGWALRGWTAEHETSFLVVGIASFVAGLVLIVYGVWFWRKITTRDEEQQRRRKRIHPVPVVLAIWFLAQRSAHACSVCYGEAEGPMIDAAKAGVWLLFGLVVVVQLAFAMFFIYLWRRARKIRGVSPAEESFQP